MYTLYSMQRSGNCYKARLALAQLGIPYDIVDLDILKGETRTPDFLAMNPSGRVPVLEVAPGRYLPESNAILWYIAGGTPLAPEDRIDRTTALQWMFFEQNSLEPYLGAAFFWLTTGQGRARIADARARGLDGEGLSGVRRDGEASRGERFLRRRPLHDRRHRALRLHPLCARVRFRSRTISRRSAPGSTASSISPAMCRWTGIRPPRRRSRLTRPA